MCDRSNDIPLVGIIVVNWNQYNYTIESIKSISRSNYKNIVTIIVDNFSTDDSVEKLKEYNGEYELVVSEKNTGWAGGNNIGIKKAIHLGCDYVLLLNNDACIYPDTIDSLLKVNFSEKGNYGVLGCVIEGYDDREIQFFGSEMNKRTGGIKKFHSDVFDDYKGLSCYESTSVIGCAMFAGITLFHKVGFIDETYFLNYEEIDWCYRARQLGVKIAIVPASRVRHKGSVSIGGARSPLNIYFMTRNRLLFAKKHATVSQWLNLLKQTLWDYDSLSLQEQGVRWFFTIFYNRNSRLKAYRRGVIDFFLGKTGDCPKSIRECQ